MENTNELHNDVIEVLRIILDNGSLNHHNAAEGIARKLFAEKSTKNLSKKQDIVFNNIIRPLLEPKCDGVMGWPDQDTCIGNGIVDEESLFLSYLEDDNVCSFCRYERDRIKYE